MASRAVHLPLLKEPEERPGGVALRSEKRAVETFSELHDAGLVDGHYSTLIPCGLPGAGQQYAFEVDLDRGLQGLRDGLPQLEWPRPR